ncbi:MFS transporter [Telmatospirillum sp.]|uniref:MFS transporter n=1 Tax=Telmatospirillum sp. TaxID=2079197 RepID=UPI002840F649|nr:MFS transporter [Telmatospirillum sp.]MDR3438648.1 MFS transporter [Telmatospirillum sp.]
MDDVQMESGDERGVAAPSLSEYPKDSNLIAAGKISARLDRLPPTRSVWFMIVLLSLGFFFELYDMLFTGYVAPGLYRSGIFTPTTPGLFGTTGIAGFMAALFSGLFIGTIGCGVLADKFGRRAIFTYSLLWYTVANVVMAFQTTAFGIDSWRFISGLGLGVEMVTIGTYISELAPKHLRGRAFACCQAVGFSAVPVVSYLSYLLVPVEPFGVEGWRWIVFIGAHGAIFVWWIRRRLPESPRWLAQNGRIDEAQHIMARLEARVESEFGRPLPPPGAPIPATPHGRFSDMWVAPYGKRMFMMIVFNIFQSIGFYGFANWVPTLVVKQGVTVMNSLLYTSIIAIAAPIGPVIGLFIADRFERKTVIMAAAMMVMASGLVFSQARNPGMIIALGICLTLGSNIMSYSYHSYQAELFPTGIRARAVGFAYSWSRFSAIFNAFLIAFFLDRFDVLGVFLFIAAAMCVITLDIALLGPRTKNLALEDIAH